MLIIAGCGFPEDLWFSVEHQVWARPEAGGLVRVGITQMGIRQAGEIYMCRPKSVGSVIEAGRSVAVVELAKSIVSVKSPLAGTVREVNPVLAASPERVHEDPYGEGWLALLAPEDWARDAAALVHGAAVEAAMTQYAWLNRIEAE